MLVLLGKRCGWKCTYAAPLDGRSSSSATFCQSGWADISAWIWRQGWETYCTDAGQLDDGEEELDVLVWGDGDFWWHVGDLLRSWWNNGRCEDLMSSVVDSWGG